MSRYIEPYIYGKTDYRDYLQTKEFVKDITDSSTEVRMEISQQSREMIATVDQLGKEQIEVMNSLGFEVEGLRDDVKDGFETISYDMEEVSKGIKELRSTCIQGFSQMISGIGRVNDSLEQLISIEKAPAQTWAYEQFKVGCDDMRRGLYPEARESFNRAINGFGDHTGYKQEFRFHYSLGILHQGDSYNNDRSIIDLAKAETDFVAAGRYAKTDFPLEAGIALTAAGWSAYCQGKMNEAIRYTEQAIVLYPQNGEAHFQAAKIQMHLGNPAASFSPLRKAIEIDRNYSLKAAADGDFKKHGDKLNAFLETLRLETIERAQQAIKTARTKLQLMNEWHAEERAPKEVSEAVNYLKLAESHLTTGTFFGALDAELAAVEAMHFAEDATSIQIEGFKREVNQSFVEAGRLATTVSEVASELPPRIIVVVEEYGSVVLGNVSLLASEHSPKALANAKADFESANSRRSSGNSYAELKEDSANIQKAIAAFHSAQTLAAKRAEEVAEVMRHNSVKIEAKWSHGFAMSYLSFVIFQLFFIFIGYLFF